jgi:O-antigen/teichoic acid export membrane protein
MIRKFLTGTQFYIYSAYLPTVISLFTLPIITPYLTLRDYGVYGLLFAVYSLVSLVFNLGFTVEYQNSYFNSPEDYKQKWSEILGFQLCWNLITLLPFCIILYSFGYSELTFREVTLSVAMLLLPYLVFDPVKTVGSRLLQYTERHSSLFVISTFATILQYALVVTLIINYRMGFLAWFVGNFVNTAVTTLIFFFYLRHKRIGVRLNMSVMGLKHRVKTQTAIIMHNVSGYIMETSDRILLALFKVPIEQIGLYNIAYNYSNYGQTVNNALNTVFSPIYFKSVRNAEGALSQEQLERLFKFWINLVFFMAVNMIIWSDYLFNFLYRNDSLKSAYIYSFPMIVALLYRPFYVMVAANLIIQDKPRFLAIMTASGAILNILLNIILIPYFGIVATVYTTAIAYLFLGFAGFFFGKIKKELSHIYIRHHVALLAVILFCMVLVYFINFSLLYVKAITFVLSLLVLFLYNRAQIKYYLKGKFY